MAEIEDGRGTGNKAEVKNHRLYVYSINLEEGLNSSKAGEAFNVNTGLITLTSSAAHAVLYIKNTSPTKQMVIQDFFYILGGNTGGSGDGLVYVLRNPTLGSIVSTATSVEIQTNRNFNSTNPLSFNAYKGFQDATFTNGDKFLETILNNSVGRIAVPQGNVLLSNGNSAGIVYTPPAGTTNQDAEFAMNIYFRDPDLG